jgi:hypothetical protein
MVELIPMTVEEKWASIVRYLGILNEPENVSAEKVITLHIHPSKLGNGEKYLKLKKIKETVKYFKTKALEGKGAGEYDDRCYSVLNRIAVLDEIEKILAKDFSSQIYRGFE